MLKSDECLDRPKKWQEELEGGFSSLCTSYQNPLCLSLAWLFPWHAIQPSGLSSADACPALPGMALFQILCFFLNMDE